MKAKPNILPLCVRMRLVDEEQEREARETAQRPRCASLTRRGRPCKARPHDSQIPFCHSHIPRGPVEFVGGGPLDGMFFYKELWGTPVPSEIMGIGRDKEGHVVLCQPSGGALQDPKQYGIGVYRFHYHGLVPEWRWERNEDGSG